MQESRLREAHSALSFLWDLWIGWKTKGLRRNRAIRAATIAPGFPRKVKP
jgi:hypothetical protein